MCRLIFGILSAGLLVASIVLWTCSLNKTWVVAHFGDVDIRALNGELYLQAPHPHQPRPSGVVRSFAGFGYLNAPDALIFIIPLWAVVSAAGMPYLLVLIWRRYPTDGHCPRCGYNLVGNTSGVCPGCGSAVETKPANANQV